MSAARGRSTSRSVGPEEARASERAVARAIDSRGHKVINEETGALEVFVPSKTDLEAMAPKQRKAARGDAAAERQLNEMIDKLIAQRQASNLHHAKVFMGTLIKGGIAAAKEKGKSFSVPTTDQKDKLVPNFASALLKGNMEAAKKMVRYLISGREENALRVMNANMAVSMAMAAKVAEKSAKRGAIDEVAAAFAAIKPEYAGYRPDTENRATYKSYMKIKSAAARNAALLDYLEDEGVAAKIAAALTRRRGKEKEAVEAMRSVSPIARVAARMDLESARRNVAAYIGEGKAYRDSNVRRLAEIRARGLGDLTARQYFKMIRDAFMVKRNATKKAKKPSGSAAGSPAGSPAGSAAGSGSSSNNGGAAGGAGAAAAGAGANAPAVGRRSRFSPTRRAGTGAKEAAAATAAAKEAAAGKRAGAESLMAAMMAV